MPEKVGNVRAALSRHRPTNGAEPEIGNVTNLRTVVKSATTDTGTDADIQGRNTVFRSNDPVDPVFCSPRPDMIGQVIANARADSLEPELQ